MGSVCSRKKDRISSSPRLKELIFINEASESSFIELSSPRYGRSIKWKQGAMIGEGAFAKVYECLNTATGELMALKRFELSDNASRNQQALKNVLIEMSLLRQLDHPNIVRYFQADLSLDNTHIDVVLEYVPSGSLRHLLKKYKKLAEDVIKTYTRQLIRGLAYLHEHGVVHRDLKAANVLITSHGEVKLTDFGSSKQLEETDFYISKSLRGSPYWMAPEVARREGHSYPADIWSFGCLLIEMVSGKPPWWDVSRDSKHIMACIASPGQYPRIPKCSEELKELIGACIEREPTNRPGAHDLPKYQFYHTECNLDWIEIEYSKNLNVLEMDGKIISGDEITVSTEGTETQPESNTKEYFKKVKREINELKEYVRDIIPERISLPYEIKSLQVTEDNEMLLVGTKNMVLVVYNRITKSFQEVIFTTETVDVLGGQKINWVETDKDLISFNHQTLSYQTVLSTEKPIKVLKEKERYIITMTESSIDLYSFTRNKVNLEVNIYQSQEKILNMDANDHYIMLSEGQNLKILDFCGELISEHLADSTILSLTASYNNERVTFITEETVYVLLHIGTPEQVLRCINKEQKLSIVKYAVNGLQKIIGTEEGEILVSHHSTHAHVLRKASKCCISDIALDSASNIYCTDTNKIYYFRLPDFPYAKNKLIEGLRVKEIFMSQTGKYVFFIDNELKLIAWNHLEDSEDFFELTSTPTIFLNLDDEWFLIADHEKVYTVNIWTKVYYPIETDEISPPVTAMATCEQNEMLFIADNSFKIMVSSIEGEFINILTGHYSKITKIDSISKYLLSLCEESTLILHCLETFEILHTIRSHKISTIKIDPSSHFFTAGRSDGYIELYCVRSGIPLITAYGHQGKVTEIVFSQKSNYFMTFGEDLQACLWVLTTMVVINRQKMKFFIESFGRSRDGSYMVGATDEIIWVGRDYLSEDQQNIIGPPDLVSSFAKYCHKILSMKNIPKYKPEMDEFLIVPEMFNVLLLYVYFNLPSHLKKGLRNNAALTFTSGSSSLISLAVHRKFKSCVSVLIGNLKKKAKFNPLLATSVNSDTLIKLNRLGYTNVSLLYDILMRKAETHVPKFCSKNVKLPIYKNFHIMTPNYQDFMDKSEISSEGRPILFEHSLCTLNLTFGSKKSIEFLKSLIECQNREVLESRMIENILNYKWKTAAPFLYIQYCNFEIFIISLCLFTLFPTEIWLLYIMVIPAILMFVYEIYEFYNLRLKYLKSSINLVDMMIVLIFFHLIITITIEYEAEIDLAVLEVVVWIREFIYFRLFATTRYMVFLIKEVALDMIGFGVLLIYTTIAFSLISHIFEEQSGSFWNNLLDSYLVDFGTWETEDYSFFEYLCFILVTLINTLIMLNLLISIMGDTFDRVEESRVVADRKELAEEIIEVEELVFWNRDIDFPQYFHVCSKASEKHAEEDEWLGKVNEIKKRLKVSDQILEKTFIETTEKLNFILSQLRNK